MPGANPDWKSALDDHVEAGVWGDTRSGSPGVILQERRVKALVQVAATDSVADVARVFPALEPCPFPQPGRACRGAEYTVMWIGPGQWWLVSNVDLGPRVCGDAVQPEFASEAVITDLSHARTAIRIAGQKATDVLLKGCPLDLEAFTVDDCAGSLIGHVNVQIHRVGDLCFDVYAFRSMGLALWHWMRDASMEYGVEIRLG